MLSTIGRKPTAKEAWEAVKIMRMGVDRVRESNAQKLRRDLNNIAFKDGESIDDFYMRIISLVNNLRLLGDTIDKIEVVQKMLQVVPERFDQVAIFIETLLDVGTMTAEEVTERLRAVEQRHEARRLTAEMDSRLLLSTKEEEMIRRMRRQEKETVRGGGGFGSSSGSSRPGLSQPNRAREAPRKAVKEDQCRYCKKYGHWGHDCRKKKRDEAANLVQAQEDEEDEPALMMVQVASITSPVHDEMATADGRLYLIEERATVQLGALASLSKLAESGT